MMFFMLPVSAGELEQLIINNEKMVLYLYTPECSYCVKFNPIFEKLENKFGNKCKFLKVNANTEYGYMLMYATRGTYVPNVILIDSKNQVMNRMEANCLLNMACANESVSKLVNK